MPRFRFCRSFTDAGLNDTHTCTVNWDDGQGPLRYSATETAGSDHCKQKSYSAAGVYTIRNHR